MNAVLPMFQMSEKGKQHLKTIMFCMLIAFLMLAFRQAFATDGAEFDDAVAKWEGWIQGNLGKLAAFIAIGVGSVVAAVKKDWSWFFGAVVLAMGIGVIVGIVNASFTAVI